MFRSKDCCHYIHESCIIYGPLTITSVNIVFSTPLPLLAISSMENREQQVICDTLEGSLEISLLVTLLINVGA